MCFFKLLAYWDPVDPSLSYFLFVTHLAVLWDNSCLCSGVYWAPIILPGIWLGLTACKANSLTTFKSYFITLLHLFVVHTQQCWLAGCEASDLTTLPFLWSLLHLNLFSLFTYEKSHDLSTILFTVWTVGASALSVLWVLRLNFLCHLSGAYQLKARSWLTTGCIWSGSRLGVM